MNSIRRFGIVLLAMGLLTLAGCGGGEKDKADKPADGAAQKDQGQQGGKDGAASKDSGAAGGLKDSSRSDGGGAPGADAAAGIDHALNLLPDNPIIVASITPADIAATSLVKQLRATFPEMDEGLRKMEAENIGLKLADIKRITIGVTQLDESGFIAVIEAGIPISLDYMKQNVKEFQKAEFEVETVGGHTLALMKQEFGPQMSIGFVGQNTMVVGVGPDNVRNILTRGSPAKLAASMRPLIAQANFRSSAAAAADLTAIPAEMKEQMKTELQGSPAAAFLVMMESIDTATLNVNIGQDVALKLSVNCADAQTAFKLGNMVQTLAGMAAGEAPELAPFINALKVDNQDKTAVLSLTVTSQQILDAAKKAQAAAQAAQRQVVARGIVNACIQYAQGSNEQFPPHLGILAEHQYFSPDFVVVPEPGTKVSVPDKLFINDKSALHDWVNENSSFVYVPRQKATIDSQQVVTFERVTKPGATNVVIGFGDGHTEARPYAEADALVKEKTGKSIADWSKLKKPGAGMD